MKVDIKVPSPGESITEVQLAQWLVENGVQVEKDDEVAEIDSDKASLSISAEEEGKIELLVEEGDTIEVGAVVARIDTEAKGKKKEQKEEKKAEPSKEERKAEKAPVQKEQKPEAEKEPQKEPAAGDQAPAPKQEETAEDTEEAPEEYIHVTPLARKLMEEKDIDAKDIVEFYRHLRITKKDVEEYEDKKDQVKQASTGGTQQNIPSWGGSRDTERKQMSTLRAKLSKRLVAVKNETAMLTTFNEVKMDPIMNLKKKYNEEFKQKYGYSIGFMSFFAKAITEALREFPQVNSMIDGNEIVYHNYADIGIAVAGPKGLVVPIVRNAETKSIPEIEGEIKTLAKKARDNKITLDEMTGGTFTITNGGVFGSMLSTPIINPPQSAILGMHNIQDRPVAEEGKVVIRKMMYVALSYDHRTIDGKESVSFLVKVKELLENPVKLLIPGGDPDKTLLGL
ncbi:MAG: 2-oxoglutarate dehydrogenase complex dihydrolipoyllysine-residue succinyltransferase [Bacteroidales bacterium]|nr:2-oxoglutarate dehydrogenase complex dihydrolipoyllysine-residue succinyltransferase [Bacteroidales bacterium]